MSNSSNENNELQGVVESLTEGVNNSREEAYSALNEALEGNAKMMRMFGELLEELYIKNVRLSSKLKPTKDGNIQIDFTINNSTPFPIVSMMGEFDFNGFEVDILCTEDSLFQCNKNLDKCTKVTESILIKSNQDVVYGAASIHIQYPHPINSKMIKLEHLFGIYVIDQLIKTSVNKSKVYKYGVKLYPVKLIRKVLEIHPIKGMEIGMCIELSSKNFKVVCEIVKFSKDLEMVEIEFSSDSNQDDNNRIISRLIEELNKLS